jgi:hypothetical protein
VPPLGQVGQLYPAGHPDDISASDDAIWLLDCSEQGMLYRFDPAAKQDGASIGVGLDSGTRRENLAVDAQGVWVAYPGEDTLLQIAPHTNSLVGTYHLPADALGPIALSPDAVWAANRNENRLTRIDRVTHAVVATVAVPAGPDSVAYGAGAVWVCSKQGGTSGPVRVNAQQNQVTAHIDVSNGAGDAYDRVHYQAGALWVLALDPQTQRNDLLERIDPTTTPVVGTVHLAEAVQLPFAVDARGVWACVGDTTTVLDRIDATALAVSGSLATIYCGGPRNRWRGVARLGLERATRPLHVSCLMRELLARSATARPVTAVSTGTVPPAGRRPARGRSRVARRSQRGTSTER